ncbi:MAG: TolC family protein [Elusimicrobiota bacterium]|jgi:outer membrane protein TolC
MNPALLAALLGLAGPLWGQAPELRIGLAAVETAAVRNSSTLKALDQELAASRSRADSRWSGLWPRLYADASWKYISEVPAMTVAGRSQALGDHRNYSVGPALGWTIWDQGALRQAWKSAQTAAQSKDAELRAAGLQLRLRARAAYFQAQLDLEQVRLLADALKLAQDQYRDIEARRQAGASSFIDSLSAHQEELHRRRLFRQARADLAAALRDLFALTGEEAQVALSLPFAAGAVLPEGSEPASVAVTLDPPGQALALLESAARAGFDPEHPRLRQLAEAARSGRQAAAGIRAGLWPRIQVQAKTSLDYPNGPVLEKFRQDTVAASAAFPIFEFGRTRREAGEAEHLASALDQRLAQLKRDLNRDWSKARDQFASLQAQSEIDRISVRETKELARRIYDSYKAGRSTFLEVQSANLKELEAQVQAARTDAQKLMQLALLDDLARKEP